MLHWLTLYCVLLQSLAKYFSPKEIKLSGCKVDLGPTLKFS